MPGLVCKPNHLDEAAENLTVPIQHSFAGDATELRFYFSDGNCVFPDLFLVASSIVFLDLVFLLRLFSGLVLFDLLLFPKFPDCFPIRFFRYVFRIVF